MKLKYWLFVVLTLFLTSVCAVSCGEDETEAPNSTDTDSSVDDSQTQQPANPEQQEPASPEQQEPEEEESPSVITFISGGQGNGFFIAYGSDEEYSAALSIRQAIAEATAVTVTANPYYFFSDKIDTDTPKLIIGRTNSVSANSKIDAYLAQINDSREYFFFIQTDKDLILYATSEDAYLLAADKFPDIFLKNDVFSCTEALEYLEFIE